MRTKEQKIIYTIISVIALIASAIIYFVNRPAYSDSVLNVPQYGGVPYVAINDNMPEFDADLLTDESYEFYSELDLLGRCGYAIACVGTDIMPTEERESISQVKPTGWVQAQYDFVDGESLYNRCHLIGFQLTGENANERNLITGTRYMNVQGMLPFENMVADYVKETDNHVMYRVTPVFEGEELVARGVQMEAYSVEDNGEGVCYNVYVYNVQPGITIDYRSGGSVLEGENFEATDDTALTYVLNVKSKKFHSAECGQAADIDEDNARNYTGDRDALVAEGYTPAGCCKP